MDIKLKILCVDDSSDYIAELKNKMKRTLSNLNFVLKLDYFDDYDDFFSEKIENKGPECFHEYDLILIDFNLNSDNPTLKNGTEIVKSIRKKNVLTTIIFYSKNYSEMVDSYGKANYDDVILEEREFLNDRVTSIAKKLLIRDLSIISIRGLFLDRTSYFDYVMLKSIGYFEKKLTQAEKDFLVKLIYKYNNIYEDFKNNHQNCKDYLFKLFNEKTKDTNFSIKSKYHIFDKIIKYFNDKVLNNFNLYYYTKNIQLFRDELAHKKLVYSDDKTGIVFYNSDNTMNVYSRNKFENLRKELVIFNIFFEYVEENIENDTFKHK